MLITGSYRSLARRTLWYRDRLVFITITPAGMLPLLRTIAFLKGAKVEPMK